MIAQVQRMNLCRSLSSGIIRNNTSKRMSRGVSNHIWTLRFELWPFISRFGASPCSGPVSGHLRRRGLGQTHKNKGDVQNDLPHSKKIALEI